MTRNEIRKRGGVTVVTTNGHVHTFVEGDEPGCGVRFASVKVMWPENQDEHPKFNLWLEAYIKPSLEPGVTLGAEAQPQRAPVTPNRLKFANLVQKLNPMDPDYAAQVVLLDRNYRAREDMQVNLKAKIWVAEAPGLTDDQRVSLNDALRVAIDRWVVDHF